MTLTGFPPFKLQWFVITKQLLYFLCISITVKYYSTSPVVWFWYLVSTCFVSFFRKDQKQPFSICPAYLFLYFFNSQQWQGGI